MQLIQSIQNRIYEVRGERVMLDKDPAALYDTETKRLKEAVNRNIKRFPTDFLFRVTNEEWAVLRPHIELPRYLPFTEQGVAMLSGICTALKQLL